MAYSSLGTKIGNYIAQELHYSEEQKEVLVYAVDSLVLGVLGFVMIMTVGTLLQAPQEVFLIAVTGVVLRKFSGGAHFRSPLQCLVTGAIVYPLGGWFIKKNVPLWAEYTYINWLNIFIVLIILLIVYLYAPVDSEAKPIISRSFRKRLHRISMVIIIICSCIAYFLPSSLGAAMLGGLFLQTLTLLPIFNTKGR